MHQCSDHVSTILSDRVTVVFGLLTAFIVGRSVRRWRGDDQLMLAAPWSAAFIRQICSSDACRNTNHLDQLLEFLSRFANSDRSRFITINLRPDLMMYLTKPSTKYVWRNADVSLEVEMMI